MSVKVHVVFYSMYGHVYRMAEAVATGAGSVPGVDVVLQQVPETLPAEALAKMGAVEARKTFEHVPVADPDSLAEADAIIFGTPTRFGNMCAQMRAFLDRTGGLWAKGALIDKIGSVFVSTGTQHGGHETTITSFHSTLLHHGMLIVGCPCSEPGITNMTEITGGSPYGAGTLAGGDGSRHPSENELKIARFQGAHVARLALKMNV